MEIPGNVICERQQIPSPGTPAGHGTGVGRHWVGPSAGTWGRESKGGMRFLRTSALQVPTAAILWGLAGSPSPHVHQQLNGERGHQAGLLRPSHALCPRLREERMPGASQAQSGCRDCPSQVSTSSWPIPTPHDHHGALGRLNGAVGRGSRGGGGQAVKEVISPQLAPLPRSTKGGRKPPGPPPVVPSPQQPGLSLSHTRADASNGHPAIHSGHAYPTAPNPGSRCKAPLSCFPNAHQASASPSVQWSQGLLSTS